MDNVKKLLVSEIENECGKLEELEFGSNEYKSAIDSITKLTDRVIEMVKLEIEEEQKSESHRIEEDKIRMEFETKEEDRKLEERKIDVSERDVRLKATQTKDTKVDQLLKNGIAIAGVIIPSLITIWGTVKTLKFEETGTVTTIMGRGFTNKLLPKK